MSSRNFSSSSSIVPSPLTGMFSSRLPFLLTMSTSIGTTWAAVLYLWSSKRLPVVVPTADAGVGLPGMRQDVRSLCRARCRTPCASAASASSFLPFMTASLRPCHCDAGVVVVGRDAQARHR